MLRASRVLTSVAMLVVLVSRTVCAATPPGGTITELTPTASYTAGPFLVPNPTPTPLVGNGPNCDTAHPCAGGKKCTPTEDYDFTFPCMKDSDCGTSDVACTNGVCVDTLCTMKPFEAKGTLHYDFAGGGGICL